MRIWFIRTMTSGGRLITKQVVYLFQTRSVHVHRRRGNQRLGGWPERNSEPGAQSEEIGTSFCMHPGIGHYDIAVESSVDLS